MSCLPTRDEPSLQRFWREKNRGRVVIAIASWSLEVLQCEVRQQLAIRKKPFYTLKVIVSNTLLLTAFFLDHRDDAGRPLPYDLTMEKDPNMAIILVYYKINDEKPRSLLLHIIHPPSHRSSAWNVPRTHRTHRRCCCTRSAHSSRL